MVPVFALLLTSTNLRRGDQYLIMRPGCAQRGVTYTQSSQQNYVVVLMSPGMNVCHVNPARFSAIVLP